MEYDNTNRGQIWRNDKKETDTQPDFKGSINVEGKEYWLAAWKRKADANPKAPALSFSIQPKEDDGVGHRDGQGGASSNESPLEDDQIPF